jgi:hypothetical protein
LSPQLNPERRSTAVHRLDLPPQYHSNVYREAPFRGASENGAARTKAESDDVIAFLKTLADGYGTVPTVPRRTVGASARMTGVRSLAGPA